MFIAGDVETVTVLRDAGRDKFGDEIAPTAEIALPGCLFAPGASHEFASGSTRAVQEASNQVDTDAIVYAPVGTDVRATDRLRVRGADYQVVGHPQVWGSAGVVIELRRTTG